MRRAWLLLALLLPAVASAAPAWKGWAAGAYLQGPEEGGDATAPTITTRSIDTTGLELTLGIDESASQGAGYADTDFTLTCSGGAATLASASGDGTASHVYDISRAIASHETCTLAHDGSADSIEDAAGNDLAAFSGASVTNSSTADTIAPTVTSARISGTTLTVPMSETVEVGAGGSGGFAIASCSGGAVTPTFVAAGASLTFSLSRAPDPAETGCVLGYTQPTNGIEDAAGNDLATFSGQAITISSGDNCPAVLPTPIKQPIKTPVRLPLCA